MRGGRICLLVGASGLALSQSGLARAQDATPATASIQERPETPAGSNARAVSFTVPLVSLTRAYGDVLIEVGGAGDQVRVRAEDIQRELAPILNEQGRAALAQALQDNTFVPLPELADAGFEFEFNMNRLELAVVRVAAEFRSVRPLIPTRDESRRDNLTRMEPASFSSYLNIVGNFDHSTEFGTENPEIFLDGATRIGNVVAEYDGAFTDQFGSSYQFARRSTRFVYDDPANYRRYSAGDLRLESLSILPTPQIVGIGVEKRKRIFEPGLSLFRLGGRQIFINNRSTVDVLVDGQVTETLQLDAGAYDLSSLPIRQGSNDIDLVIRDSFGQQETISYNFIFETLPLVAGEEEYSIGIGFLSDNFSFEPNYTDEIAFSGFYRKALSENLIVGGTAQLSEDVQLIGANLISVPQFIPGVFDLELAGSSGEGESGIAVRAGYQYSSGNGLTNSNQLSLNFSYESAGFTTLNNILPIDFDLLNVTATYSRSFGFDTVATVGGSYFTGGNFNDDYTLFLDVSHRLTDRLRFTAGVEYGQATTNRSSFGVRLGVAVALGGGTRASADYRSRLDNFRANLSNGADNTVGSFGYDLGVSRFGDETRADAQLEYEGNRFTSRLDLTSRGPSFSGVTDEQRVRLQVGTSIAVAGKQFGIGRPINNSFLLADANPAIRGQDVITGRSIRSGEYYARSGVLGSAVQGNLSSYTDQSVQFDAADAETGFDVGDGVVLVEPPYKSGYAVIAGNANYVSLIGTLLDGAEPVALAAGTVTDLETGEPTQDGRFFTNSAGRFGVFGLAPGRRYRVVLAGSERSFVLDVPLEADPILRVGNVTLADGQ